MPAPTYSASITHAGTTTATTHPTAQAAAAWLLANLPPLQRGTKVEARLCVEGGRLGVPCWARAATYARPRPHVLAVWDALSYAQHHPSTWDAAVQAMCAALPPA